MSAAGADRRTETERIEAALKAVPWPAYVREREWKRDWDWAGDEAIWIWVVVSDFSEIEASSPSWRLLPRSIREALSAEGLDLRVYLRVKEVIEQPKKPARRR
jgi:hypothetical protein